MNKPNKAKAVEVRKFETGATRSSDSEKMDYEGFLSPLVLERYAAYMHKHRKQVDGTLRASDNWQKGIPHSSYMKSLWRHFMDVWKNHRGYPTVESQEENLCALIFNASGKLYEILQSSRPKMGHIKAADCFPTNKIGGTE